MRRLFIVTLTALLGGAAVASGVVVSSAAQANQIEQFTIFPGSCEPNSLAVGVQDFTLDRDNTGAGREALRFSVHDGAGELLRSVSHGGAVGTPISFTIGFGTSKNPTVNPITATAVSIAGNGYEELLVASAELYCPNLPGSIVTTPASLAYPDAADVSGTLVPFVEELAGSAVTYSAHTAPASGDLTVNPDGTFTYQWGAGREVSFEALVTNAEGQTALLPVTLARSMLSHTKLTSDAAEVTAGGSVTLTVRVEGEDAALPPTGVVDISAESTAFVRTLELDASGAATVTIAGVPLGTHTVTAFYRGDANHVWSTDGPIAITATANNEPGTGGGVTPAPDASKTPTQIAATGTGAPVWLVGASALALGVGVLLVARRRLR